jgi:tetratricopeptide (TPR) repeat protein
MNPMSLLCRHVSLFWLLPTLALAEGLAPSEAPRDPFRSSGNIARVFEKLDAGDWPGAAALMSRPELAQSRDPRYFAAKARLLQAVQGFERAAEPAQQSVGIDDRCVEGIAEQASVYLEAGTLDEAEKWLRRAIQTNPRYAYSYYLWSDFAQRRGALLDARKAAEIAVALNPRLSQGYLRLGDLYRQEGRLNESLQVYRRAFSQPLAANRKADVRRHLSETYTAMGNHALAVREAKEAIRLAPRLASNYRRLRDAHSAVGKVIPAIKSYERALQFEPGSASLRRVVARQYMVAGDFRRAAGFYRQIVEADRRDVEAQYELANALERAGDRERALTAYQATLALDPKRFDALVAMGRLYREKKEYEVALNSLKKAIAVNDQVPSAYEELGSVYTLLGDTDQANEAYRRALSIDGQSGNARRGLGKLLLTGGNTAAAVRELTESVRANPSDGEAHYLLAAAHCRLGDGERASEHFLLAERYQFRNTGYLLVVVDKDCLRKQRLPAGGPERR